jgi:hypothetical protein
MILSTILGDTNIDHDSLYFGCDSVYFKQFVKLYWAEFDHEDIEKNK